MCQGADRVKKAMVQTLNAEFESLIMKDTESLEDFCMKMNGLMKNMRVLGEEIDRSYVVQISSTIEQFGNLETMTIEETVGSIKVPEERMRGQSDNTGGQLHLSEEAKSGQRRKGTKVSFFSLERNG